MTIPSAAIAAATVPLRTGLPRQLRWGLLLALQFLLLVLLCYAGTALVSQTGVPLPGNLVGMLLLLRSGVVRLDQVQDAAALVLTHLNFFFVPLAVGLMAWGGLLGTSGAGLALSLAGSAAVCLAVAGLIGQRLAPRGGESDVR